MRQVFVDDDAGVKNQLTPELATIAWRSQWQ
jgi:hypothetical protein